MSIGRVTGILRSVGKKIRTSNDDLEFRRVYIPKNEREFRPLGVPSGEWRVIMHMWNNWITLFVKDHLEFNHAYIPGKGAHTALKKVIDIQDYKYIYEFDLKQFFPSVDIDVVTNMLQELGMPKGLTYWLENINRAAPKLTEEDKVDETVARDRYKIQSHIRAGVYDPMDSIYEQINAIGNPELVKQMMQEDGYDNVFEWMQAQWAAFDHYGLGGAGNLFKGLPQGLNTSPILSLLQLIGWKNDLERKGIGVVMYADDGILYSKQPFKPFSPAGIDFNLSKSGWIREGGVAKEFKFLGIKINYETQSLQAETKKGSTLEMGLNDDRIFEVLAFVKKIYEMQYKDPKITLEGGIKQAEKILKELEKDPNIPKTAIKGITDLIDYEKILETTESLKEAIAEKSHLEGKTTSVGLKEFSASGLYTWALSKLYTGDWGRSAFSDHPISGISGKSWWRFYKKRRGAISGDRRITSEASVFLANLIRSTI